MDLQTIKRNMESGVIRTTEEFQRDVMLMCINAITYNRKGHNVHDMASNLMTDALAKIEVRSSISSTSSSYYFPLFLVGIGCVGNTTLIFPVPKVWVSFSFQELGLP